MDEKIDKLGQLIDRLDNLAIGLTTTPMSAEIHLDLLKIVLPERVREMKEVFVEVFGYNPWE